MSDIHMTPEEYIEVIDNNPQVFETMVEALSGSSRRARQHSAKVLREIAGIKPEAVLPVIPDLVDALNRPEAQTRWECLDAISQLVALDADACATALDGAETALFDEESGPLRLAAMRYLCQLGSVNKQYSKRCWPLIDEGIQCYHGDFEFQDMLVAVMSFAQGYIDDEVKAALKERMSFDAQNSKGLLKKRAQQIVEAVS